MATTNGIDFTHLMNSGQFSDLTLVCQGKEFKVHRLVACSQSSVIATALKGEFQEAESGVINIELFGPESVRRMVEYLYTGDYDQVTEESKVAAAAVAPLSAATSAASSDVSNAAPSDVPNATSSDVSNAISSDVLNAISSDVLNSTPSTTPSASPSTAKSQDSSIASNSTSPPAVIRGTLHHVRVNAIADYYGIPGLAMLANQKIQQAYLANWNSNAFVVSAKAAIDDSGDKSLHDVMALHTAQNLNELLKSGHLPDLVGDFAASVLCYHAHLLEARQQEQSQIAMRELQQQQQAQAQQLAQAQLAAQQQQNELETRCQAAEARPTRIIENVGKLVNLTNSQKCCRNGSCRAGFGSYLEVTGDPTEPMYILRCSHCRCRHTAI